jgi:hypothetical protein
VTPDQAPYPPIGKINAEGLWVVTAAQADALPEGSLISLVGDERGRARSHAATEPHDERPFQGWAHVDGRWVGPTELAPEAIYRVHLPLSPSHIPGEVAMGRSQVETALARSRQDPYARGSSAWVAAQRVIPGRKNRDAVP